MFATFSALRKRLTSYVFSRPGTAVPAGHGSRRGSRASSASPRPTKGNNSKVKNGRVGKTSSVDKTSAIKEKLRRDYKMSGALDDIDEDEVEVVFNDEEDTLITDAPDPDDRFKDPTLVLLEDELSSGSDDLRGTRSPRLSSVERGEHFLNIENERIQRQKTLNSIAHGDWTTSEVELFNKLNLRGFEPLFHVSWLPEFNTCPTTLFTEDPTECFIGSNFQSKFRATKALSSLTTLGVRVRDRLLGHHTTEPTLNKGINDYIRWSHQDGDLNRYNFIPALVVKAKGQDETVAEVVARTTVELHALGDRYRDQWGIRGSIEGGNGGSNDDHGDDDQDNGGKGKGKAEDKGKGKAEEKGKGKTEDKGKGKAKDKGKGKAKDDGNSTTLKIPKTSKPSTTSKKGGKGSGPSGSTAGPSSSTAGPSKPSTVSFDSSSTSSDSTVTAGPSGVIKIWTPEPPIIIVTSSTTTTTTTTKKSTPKTAKSKGKAKAVETDEVEFAHELPTLYGLIIANTIVAIVSYNVAVPHKALRTIAIFDFGDNDQDVWNAFAVAIVVVTVRNLLMGLEWEDKVEEAVEDPDL